MILYKMQILYNMIYPCIPKYRDMEMSHNEELTLLIIETEYSGLFSQYHACWCPGDWSRQGISRHGIDSIE